MTSVENLRNSIIEKILAISDKEFLGALSQFLEKTCNQERVSLSKEQIALLKLSDKDIVEGRLVPQQQVDEEDLKWLRQM